jgi:speckle-type POZ protein
MEDYNQLGRIINYPDLNSGKFYYQANNLRISVELEILIDRSSKDCPLMAQQYEKLFNNEKFSDFTLILSDGQEVPVHKNIMSIRSPVFERMMEINMRESEESKCKIEDIEGRVMMEFLRFIYCGHVENIDEIAADLLYVANKYDVPDLKPLCSISMVSKLALENVLQTAVLADLHGDEHLKSYCELFIMR